jgi:hypothetical protein
MHICSVLSGYVTSGLLWQQLCLTRRGLFFTSKMNLELKKKVIKCYTCSIAVYGAETWTLRAADQKHLVCFEMWCWRRLEISWTDRVRN